MPQCRLLRRDLCQCLLKLCLVLGLLNSEEQRFLLNLASVDEVNLVEITFDPRNQGYRLGGHGITREVPVVCDALHHWPGHSNRGGISCSILLALAPAHGARRRGGERQRR